MSNKELASLMGQPHPPQLSRRMATFRTTDVASRQVAAAASQSKKQKAPETPPKLSNAAPAGPPSLFGNHASNPQSSNASGPVPAPSVDIFQKTASIPVPNNPKGLPTARYSSSDPPPPPWPTPTKKLQQIGVTQPKSHQQLVVSIARTQKAVHNLEDSVEDKSGEEEIRNQTLGQLRNRQTVPIHSPPENPPMTVLEVDQCWVCHRINDEHETRIVWPTTIDKAPGQYSAVRAQGDIFKMESFSMGFEFPITAITKVKWKEQSETDGLPTAPFVFIHLEHEILAQALQASLKQPPSGSWFVLRIKQRHDGDFPVIQSTVEKMFAGVTKIASAGLFTKDSWRRKIGDLSFAMPKPPKPEPKKLAKPKPNAPVPTAKFASKRVGSVAKATAAKRKPEPKPIETITLDAEDDDQTTDAQPDAGLPKKLNPPPPRVPSTKTSDTSDGEYGGDTIEIAPPRVAQTILVYPQNQPDAVTIVDEDMARLQPNECLNDSLIDFWLRYWYGEILTDEQRKKVHVFNTFFFNTMAAGNTGPQKVIRWTNKIDIFGYDYVLMPVNQAFHWRLAVVCFPKYIKLSRADKATVARNRKYLPTILVLDSMGVSGTGIAPPTRMFFELESEKESRKDYKWPTHPPDEPPPADEAAPSQESNINLDTTNTSSEDGGRTCSVVIAQEDQSSPPPPKKGKKTAKADASKGPEPTFNTRTMPAILPNKLPRQENFTDCGVYLLCYAEEFVKNPPPTPSDKGSVERHFQETMKHITPDVINEKRKMIRDTIFRLANKTPEQIAEIDRINGVTRAVVVPDATQPESSSNAAEANDAMDVDTDPKKELPHALAPASERPQRRSTRQQLKQQNKPSLVYHEIEDEDEGDEIDIAETAPDDEPAQHTSPDAAPGPPLPKENAPVPSITPMVARASPPTLSGVARQSRLADHEGILLFVGSPMPVQDEQPSQDWMDKDIFSNSGEPAAVSGGSGFPPHHATGSHSDSMRVDDASHQMPQSLRLHFDSDVDADGTNQVEVESFGTPLQEAAAAAAATIDDDEPPSESTRARKRKRGVAQQHHQEEETNSVAIEETTAPVEAAGHPGPALDATHLDDDQEEPQAKRRSTPLRQSKSLKPNYAQPDFRDDGQPRIPRPKSPPPKPTRQTRSKRVAASTSTQTQLDFKRQPAESMGPKTNPKRK
eukprot:TRINITY_DN6290_c0_g1_i1.p1 TRINITY_DN6290_c0_g1~~TRINITY_DN6290_c0_g1_i1.p1  ORF type:complete len:1210 (-),score=253.30 TRINITY_DN6290_c0_g1_i1:57-3584(-)